jgi:hypothetical protein
MTYFLHPLNLRKKKPFLGMGLCLKDAPASSWQPDEPWGGTPAHIGLLALRPILSSRLPSFTSRSDILRGGIRKQYAYELGGKGRMDSVQRLLKEFFRFKQKDGFYRMNIERV